MISRITGTIVEILEKGFVIETGGIGYTIFSPSTPLLDTYTTMHTHMVIRDDAHELYGFETVPEKNLFGTLISVSGVGPKTALQMLTLYPLGEIVRIIKTGDAKAISLVPGIGKKTAEKVVIDLKDKLDNYNVDTAAPNASDLVEALLSMGYKDIHIRTIVADIDTSLPIEKQITSALQLLQK